jgi:hypothetical protein
MSRLCTRWARKSPGSERSCLPEVHSVHARWPAPFTPGWPRIDPGVKRCSRPGRMGVAEVPLPPVRGALSRWANLAGCTRVRVDGAGTGVVSRAGGALLTATIRASGLDSALSAVLAPWCKPLAIHDPAKVLLDLAVALGLGADCLADIALARAEPAVFGLGGLRSGGLPGDRRASQGRAGCVAGDPRHAGGTSSATPWTTGRPTGGPKH